MMHRFLMVFGLPTNISRHIHWPARLENLADPEYGLVIQSVIPLADQSQIGESLLGLGSLVDIVCTDGHKVLTVELPHTTSFYAITCPDAGIPIHIQQSILASTLRSIILGQSVYGHAAINGQVQDRSGKQIGRVVSDVVFPAPPAFQRDWPSRVLYAPVPDSQGMRLRAEFHGPPVDNWDRFWFLKLCDMGKSEILRDVNPKEKMEFFGLVYPVVGDSFRFIPFSPLARRPTWATFVKVIDTLRDSVLEPYLAHNLQFNLIDGDGMPLGVGFFDVYEDPNAVLLSDQANSTTAFRINGSDWANSTGGERSSA